MKTNYQMLDSVIHNFFQSFLFIENKIRHSWRLSRSKLKIQELFIQVFFIFFKMWKSVWCTRLSARYFFQTLFHLSDQIVKSDLVWDFRVKARHICTLISIKYSLNHLVTCFRVCDTIVFLL